MAIWSVLFCSFFASFGICFSFGAVPKNLRSNLLSLSSASKSIDSQDGEILKRIFQYSHDGYLYNHVTQLKINLLKLPSVSVSQLMPPVDGANQKEKYIPIDSAVIHQGSGFTFAYDQSTRRLLTAWGPGLHLHPINAQNLSNIFINLGSRSLEPSLSLKKVFDSVRAEDDVSKKSMNPSKEGMQNCSKELYFEMGVAYDASFCALYGNSEQNVKLVLVSLVQHITPALLKSACVRPRIITIDGICKQNKGLSNANIFQQPPSLSSNTVDTPRQRAVNARLMLEMTAREWGKYVSANTPRDAAFLFTGYDDGTSLSGASNQNGPCLLKQSFVWLKRANPLVLAHFIGHLLGAPHSKSGIMKKQLNETQPIEFSAASNMAFAKFLNFNMQSWCLHRNFASFGILQKQSKWNTPVHIINDMYKLTNVSDMTVATFPMSKGSPSIILLISEQVRVESNHVRTLSYIIYKDISCNDNGVCSQSSESNGKVHGKQTLSFLYSPEAFGFGIGFFSNPNGPVGNLILSHIQPMGNLTRIFYRIGYSYSENGSAPETWSTERIIPNSDASGVMCTGITIGHIRSATSNDIVHVRVERRNGLNTLIYQIGFGLKLNGEAAFGWTNTTVVPGWLGHETTGVSISIIDVDKNGSPDMVLYHVDDSQGTKTAFFRVGLDLNSTGHITRGWSDFVRVPSLVPLHVTRRGTMAVAYLGGKYLSVISAQRDATLFSVDAWNLYVGTQVLTPSLTETATESNRQIEQDESCFVCSGLYSDQYCEKILKHCHLRVDGITVLNSTENN